LGFAGTRIAAQSEILAAAAVLRVRRRRPFVQRQTALGQCARSSAYVTTISQGRFPIEQLADVSRDEALEEELFLGLRQLGGIDLSRIESEYGANLQPRVEELRALGLVEWNGTRLRLSPDRLTVSNEVLSIS